MSWFSSILKYFLASLFLVFFLLSGPRMTEAANSILRGQAWWAGLNSYLYFSCWDAVVGDRLDDLNNLCGGEVNPPGGCGPPDYAFDFFAEPCSSLVHGVEIDEEGKFSGEAWHYAKGLVSFTATTSPDATAPNKSSLQTPCPACYNDANCWACYNESDQKVYGWGRSTVDGTWIRLDGEAYPTTQLKSWNAASSTVPFYNDLAAGDFIGSATSSLGNLSFNCRSEDGGADNCDERNYKVFISNLQVGYMSAPHWNYANACSAAGALRANLRWQLKSGRFFQDPNWPVDYQTAFEIVLSETDNIGSPMCTIGPITSSGNQYQIHTGVCPNFDYGTNYYWWLRLYDQNNQPTEWYQYQYNSVSDTDGNPDSEPKTFTTYKHEFPSPFFVWEPEDLSGSIGTTTEFSSFNATTSSQYYNAGSPTTGIDCDGANCQYLWEVFNSTGTIVTTPTNATTSIIFAATGQATVSLTITDNDSYMCSKEVLLTDINYGLPIWREVKAQ